MKSNYKLPLGQIEKGDELDKIDEKAVDSEVVHKEQDETIDDIKTFNKAPRSEQKATGNTELVRFKEFNTELDLRPLKTEVLLLANVNQEVDGKITFLKAPKSKADAVNPNELVRFSQYDTDMGDKAEDDSVVHKTGNKTESINGPKTFEAAPKSDIAAATDKELVRKKELDSGLADKVDTDSVSNKEITLKVGNDTVGSFTLNQETAENIDFDSFIPKVIDALTSNSATDALSAKQGKALKTLIDNIETSVSSGLDLIGGFDAGVETSFPSGASKGDTWIIEGSGNVQGEVLENGDMIIARKNTPSTTSSADWIFIQRNIDKATESKAGYIQIVNQTEMDEGVDDSKAITTFKLNKILGDLAKKDTVGTADIDDSSVTGDKLAKDYVEKEDGKSLIDDDKVTKLEGIEEGAQKNVQSDMAELDADLDSFIKNKESYIHITDTFYFKAGEEQKMPLSNELHKLISVEVNGQGLIPYQYNEWHNMIEILNPLDDKDTIKITYMAPTDYSRIHGYKYDVTVPAAEVERIGNPDMATELPLQNGMKGCLVSDDGEVNYYLKEDDWSLKADETPSDLSGADGQVMTETPRHWLKMTQKGDIATVLFSDKPFVGAKEIKRTFVGSYKAAWDRTENKLSSVVNETARYRGGNNQSAWDGDNEFKSQLGKPVTNKSRTEFRIAAQERGVDFHNVNMTIHTSVACFATYEFGTRNHQAAISEGPTNLDSTKWNDFNSRYPLFKCGLTNGFGNGTGEVTIDLSAYDLGANETQVFRYRGIENWWGDIYEWMSGVNIVNNKYYMTEGRLESDTNVDGYKLIGNRPVSNGYIQQMYPGTLLPKTNSGSSSTYFTDYLYANDTVSLKGLLRSAAEIHGARAGSFFVHSLNAPSYASAYIGSRLAFTRR